MKMNKTEFGKTCDGQIVHSYSIYHADGSFITLLSYGATLQRLLMPDRHGHYQDIVLGFDHVAGYEGEGNFDYGATIGRCSGPVRDGDLTIDGQSFQLTQNRDEHHVNGGRNGLGQVVWQGEFVNLPEGPAVNFYYHSPDGQDGYPGSLDLQVSYILTTDHRLIIRHTAVGDQKTLIGLSGHTCFNLSGQGSGSILSHRLTVMADQYLPVDSSKIPTGSIEPVAGTPFDFLHPKPIGEALAARADSPADLFDFDLDFVLKSAGRLKKCATVYDPKSGRVMDIRTTLPCLHLNTGNPVSGIEGKEGVQYDRHNSLCLMPRHFPDAVHHRNFPKPIFKAGEAYRHETEYAFKTKA